MRTLVGFMDQSVLLVDDDPAILKSVGSFLERSGYEVFRAAKEVSADTPVILMTGFGYDPHHSIVRASQEGLHSFLFKPFKAGQLVEEVKKALSASVKAGT